MTTSDERRSHWQNVYRTRRADSVSWYRPHLEVSLELLAQAGLSVGSRLIDVGGGASTLVDALLDQGVGHISVLDISRTALEHSKTRLGARSAAVSWIEADITHVDLGLETYDVWHDRAVFHFLTSRDDRQRYVACASRALRPGGAALIAAFSLQGPTRCSGLDVVRYDAELLAREFGSEFSVERTLDDIHHTPSGNTQAFTFTILRRR